MPDAKLNRFGVHFIAVGHRPWPAAYINVNQNIHQIQVLTKTFMPCSGYILFAAEQRVGYQISWVDL